MDSVTAWWRSLSRENKAFAAFVVLDLVLLVAVVVQPRSSPRAPVVVVAGPAVAPTRPPAPPTAPPALPTARPTATPKPTPTPTPIEYEAPAPRDWALIVKAPDNYVGQPYKVWACITQFDAATGSDSFRGQASYMPETFWFSATNAIFTGDGGELAEYVAGDVLIMGVEVVGSFVYDTQAGGSATVPLFRVVKVMQAQSGACG